jgi:hypothetical protein
MLESLTNTMNQFVDPTPYADVNAVLHHFAERIQAILENQFLGMYLYGSLALGYFDPFSSDIDFIVVTKTELEDDLYLALQEMHEQFKSNSSPWASRIEAAYIPQAALHVTAPTQSKYPQIEKGTRLIKAPLEIGWAFQLCTLRERGVVVSGPDPRPLASPVDLESMRQAVVAIAGGWKEQASHDPEWLEWVRHKDAQSFVVLTLCRMLYSLATGDVASKPAAARWAKISLGPEWVELINRALAGQHDFGEAADCDVQNTLAFLHFTYMNLRPDREGI